MSSRAPQVIAVLMGGRSAEREVSLSSGAQCAKALSDAGFDVHSLDVGPDLTGQLEKIKPDVVFNALHGKWGEDGCVQGILEWLGLPYTHSGVRASAVAMDKEATKVVYRAAGLPVAASLRLSKAKIGPDHPMPVPYVIKPVSEGSSVGVYLVEGGQAPPALAADMPDDLMVEAFVPGRELTVSVLGDHALGVTEIVTSGWYDFDAKYKEGGSRHICPAALPDDITAACKDFALRAHRALGCRGVTRTDFRWDDAKGLDGLILLETNTQPGMTPTSLTPEQAALHGMDLAALCTWLVEDASCER